MTRIQAAASGPDKAATQKTATQKAATQDRILQAAMEFFLRRGYARTSVTLIANRAGVSRAAVFWHFTDKDTLFRAAVKRFVVPFHETLEGKLTHLEPRKRVFELISLYQGFVEDNRPNIEAFVKWALESPEHSAPMREELLALHEGFRAELEGALAEILGDGEQAAAFANGLLSMLDGTLLLGIFGITPRARERQLSGLRAVVEQILGDPERA